MVLQRKGAPTGKVEARKNQSLPGQSIQTNPGGARQEDTAMLKKMIVLAAAAMALAAFALPAAAQANNVEWFVDPGDETLLGVSEELHIQGELETHVGAPTPFGVKQGPCGVTFTGDAYNEGGLAKATITAGAASASPEEPCPNELAGGTCPIEEVTFGSLGKANPWEVTAVENTHNVTISNVTFTNHYAEGCLAGPEVSAAGSVTGEVTTSPNANEESCIKFHNAGPLIREGSTTPVYVSGEVCITQPLTLHTA